MTTKIYQLQEATAPASYVTAALSEDFLAPLRFETPIPIHIIPDRPDGVTWGGLCKRKGDTEFSEVCIVDPSCARPEWLVIQNIQSIYIHEATHRLLESMPIADIGGSHGPVFCAVQFFLFHLITLDCPGHLHWALKTDLYDLQDTFDAELSYSPGQALDWAYRVGERLSLEDWTAEQAAVEISHLFTAWLENIAARKAKRKRIEQRYTANAKTAAEEIAALKWFAFYLAIGGVALGFFICFRFLV